MVKRKIRAFFIIRWRIYINVLYLRKDLKIRSLKIISFNDRSNTAQYLSPRFFITHGLVACNRVIYIKLKNTCLFGTTGFFLNRRNQCVSTDLILWICEILTLVDLQLGGQKARVYFRICVNWIDLLQMERDYWMKYITIVGIGVVKIRYSFHLIQRVN